MPENLLVLGAQALLVFLCGIYARARILAAKDPQEALAEAVFFVVVLLTLNMF